MSAFTRRFARAAEASAIVGSARKIARRIAAADARVAADNQWRPAEQTRERDRVAAIASTSRVIRTLESGVSAFASAWNTAAVRRLVDSAAAIPIEDRGRVIGVVLVTAVVTHIVVLALFGEPVNVLGWITRVALLAAGALACKWSNALAAAWQSKRTP